MSSNGWAPPRAFVSGLRTAATRSAIAARLARVGLEVVARNVARAITGKGKPASFDGYGECFIETGDGKAGFGRGNFYAEPLPSVKLEKVGRRWHWGKVLFEKRWLRQWF